jgi:hypothetical protein
MKPPEAVLAGTSARAARVNSQTLDVSRPVAFGGSSCFEMQGGPPSAQDFPRPARFGLGAMAGAPHNQTNGGAGFSSYEGIDLPGPAHASAELFPSQRGVNKP